MILRQIYMSVLVLTAQLKLSDATVTVSSLRGYGLTGDPVNPPDVYVKVECDEVSGGMTDFVRDSYNPTWRAKFNFPYCRDGDKLRIEVWDKDLIVDDLLGVCVYNLKRVFNQLSECHMNGGKVTFRLSVQ